MPIQTDFVIFFLYLYKVISHILITTSRISSGNLTHVPILPFTGLLLQSQQPWVLYMVHVHISVHRRITSGFTCGVGFGTTLGLTCSKVKAVNALQRWRLVTWSQTRMFVRVWLYVNDCPYIVWAGQLNIAESVTVSRTARVCETAPMLRFNFS